MSEVPGPLWINLHPRHQQAHCLLGGDLSSFRAGASQIKIFPSSITSTARLAAKPC